MSSKPKVLSAEMPAGAYFVGDPCYMFAHSTDTWSDIGEQTDWFTENTVACVKGKYLWADGTAYGDGVYTDQFGNEYCVDAGLIGVTPIELYERNALADVESLGLVITFDKPFIVSVDDGVFTIGHIVIDTASEEITGGELWR